MRLTARLFAAVSGSPSNYLVAYAPTGLTGVLTHPFPRPALIYHYTSTLEKLSKLPKESVYRQSTEALTRHRLSIIESQIPEGFEQWQEKVANTYLPQIESGEIRALGQVKRLQVKGKPYIYQIYTPDRRDPRDIEWDGEKYEKRSEGPAAEDDRTDLAKAFGQDKPVDEVDKGTILDNEPPLTVQQISAIEEQIAAGLIEEVINVAKKEEELVEVMLENQVWEELEEKPVKGQWEYNARDTSVKGTQAP